MANQDIQLLKQQIDVLSGRAYDLGVAITLTKRAGGDPSSLVTQQESAANQLSDLSQLYRTEVFAHEAVINPVGILVNDGENTTTTHNLTLSGGTLSGTGPEAVFTTDAAILTETGTSSTISTLPAATTITGNEEVAIAYGGANKRASFKNILNLGTMQALSAIIPGETGSDILMDAGNGMTTGHGGKVTMVAGAGGTSGDGGAISFTGGMGGTVSGNGGSIAFTAGYCAASSGVSGVGGVVSLAAGSALYRAGGVYISAGGITGGTDGSIGGDIALSLSVQDTDHFGTFMINSSPSVESITYSWGPGQLTNGQTIYTADRDMYITGVIGRLDTAEGSTATLVVAQAGSGTAYSGGTNITTNSMNLNGTPHATQTLALNIGADLPPIDIILSAGVSLGLVTSGSLSACGGSITIHMAPH